MRSKGVTYSSMTLMIGASPTTAPPPIPTVVLGVLVNIIAAHKSEVDAGGIVVPGQPDLEVEAGRIKRALPPFFHEIQQGHGGIADQVDPFVNRAVVELDVFHHLIGEIRNRENPASEVGIRRYRHRQ